ncbi:response regulator transcription factor [Verrucosispora sp. WMMA2044]|uniref:Response regulator transcription factor n=1 Tax=Verrucosispora sioxanthis TaxID=2499994 RepID=A0A6M1KVD1_9ACTN|nr:MULTISPECIES: response regulator transcription factor [Micromonospora]NEE63945.1 response regulator transcription factor [Verrucosispora sioxanthis]NGM13055.1 response regulator transcription factor [Verrucosispora sioxanthis]WBB51014.1 response regulator transcription factor [Verrucosispora sp. WMMA2044]
MSESPAIRVAVVDDHPLFARGLELLLPSATAGRVRVVGATGDAAAAASLMCRCLPDVALVDLHMPAPGGIRAVAAIRRTTPRVRVVAMSGDSDPTPALEALRAGAEAFLPKSAEPEALLPPLLAVLDGWAVLPAQLLRELLHSGPGFRVDLDPDERALLRSIAAGRSTLTIADQLHVSERTVKRMTAALLRKLRVGTRAEAAALAGHAGLLGD